jgi:hypothetical protein
MGISTILTILSVINGLLSVAKDAPAVIEEVKSLLAKIKPHVDATSDANVKASFADAHAKANSGEFDFSEPAPAGQDAPNVTP